MQFCLCTSQILDLAVKYKVVDLSKDKPDPIILQPDVPGFTQDGERVPKEIVQVAFDAYTKIMDKANGFYERVKKGEQIEEMPLGQYVDEEINKFLATRPEAERPLLRAVLNQMVVGEAQLNGTNSLYDISLKYYGLYKTIPGGDLFISRGFGRVIQGMIDDVTRKTNDTDQFKLLLNHEVAKIKWNGAEANSQEPVEVTCENGAVFKGRHLVNSMPLGVLQAKAKTLYEPALPKDKTDIISAFNYGDGYVSKMYLEYDEALTPRFIDSSLGDWVMIYFKLPEDVENEVKKQTNLARHWPKKVHSIKKVNDRLLSVWLSGKETVYVEKLDEKVLSKEITSLLRSVFGKAEFPEPKRIVGSQWASSPYTNGSYTSMKFGATDKDLEQLRQPIFAGNDKKVKRFLTLNF